MTVLPFPARVLVPHADDMTPAVRDILHDRRLMLSELGHTLEGEDGFVRGEMTDLVIMLLDAVAVAPSLADKRGMLSHGGALIVAEIDRLYRAEAAAGRVVQS